MKLHRWNAIKVRNEWQDELKRMDYDTDKGTLCVSDVYYIGKNAVGEVFVKYHYKSETETSDTLTMELTAFLKMMNIKFDTEKYQQTKSSLR